MFLEVADKVKYCRKQYKLKQDSFEKYGISRSQISMIENGHRAVKDEVADCIFTALYKLTSGLIENDFSRETFKLNPREQAIVYLKQHCKIETLNDGYEIYKNIVISYSLFEYGIKLEELIAYEYKRNYQWEKSNEHFLLGISYASLGKINASHFYHQVGINFQKMGFYKESNSYLKLSLNSLKLDEFKEKYKVLYGIAKNYLYMNNFSEAHYFTQIIIDSTECIEVKTKAATILLQASILNMDGKVHESKLILEEFIENSWYPPFIPQAYHNLGSIYKQSGELRKALNILNDLINLELDQIQRSLALGLIGSIYYELGDYEGAEQILDTAKEDILMYGAVSQKVSLIDALVEIYLQFNNEEKLILLFLKLKEYEKDKFISYPILTEVQKKIFKKFYVGKIKEKQFKVLINFIS